MTWEEEEAEKEDDEEHYLVQILSKWEKNTQRKPLQILNENSNKKLNKFQEKKSLCLLPSRNFLIIQLVDRLYSFFINGE